MWSILALPCVCLGFLWRLWVPPTVQIHGLRPIGDSKLTLGVSVSVCGECIPCLSSMFARDTDPCDTVGNKAGKNELIADSLLQRAVSVYICFEPVSNSSIIIESVPPSSSMYVAREARAGGNKTTQQQQPLVLIKLAALCAVITAGSSDEYINDSSCHLDWGDAAEYDCCPGRFERKSS